MGVVERVGPGVAHLNQGQRVVGARIGTGTWAEYITVPAERTVRHPPLLAPRAHTHARTSFCWICPLPMLAICGWCSVYLQFSAFAT